MRAIALVSLLGLGGCAQLDAAFAAKPSHKPSVQGSKQAFLYGIDIKQDALWFQVLSSGCTHPEHFSLLTKPLTNNQLQVTLIRNKPDLCRAKPRLVPVELDLPGVGVKQVVLTNSFVIKPRRQK